MPKISSKHWQILTVGCIILYIATSIVFIFYGELNADEGWYLYAGKLVYSGDILYKDFAFTQTPLLPYVYGFFQNFSSSPLFLGRTISVILSTTALFFSVQAAKKIGGATASALTAILWTTFTYGIYYQSITKTYALLLFFLSGAVYFVLASKDQEKERVLVSAFVILASLTRLSALFFAIPILIYTFLKGTRTTKLIIVILCAAAIVFFGFLAFSNWPATYWNIILHHTNQWGNISNIEKVKTILFQRLPLLLLAFPTYAILLIAIVGLNFTAFLTFLRNNQAIFLVLISLIMFTLPNLASGGFYSEYFIPLLFLLFPILSSVIVALWSSQSKASRMALQVILLSTFILGFLRGGNEYVDTCGGELPSYEVQELADIVQANSNTDDLVFAFEGLWIAIEAKRLTLPNMTMAQFSYFEGDSNKAVQYHLINDEMIIEAIQKREPRILILTRYDWDLLNTSDKFEDIKNSILANYTLFISQDNFGQTQDYVEIYFRGSP